MGLSCVILYVRLNRYGPPELPGSFVDPLQAGIRGWKMPGEEKKGETGKGFDEGPFQEVCDKKDDDDFLEEIYGVTDEEYQRSLDRFLSGRSRAKKHGNKGKGREAEA